jgi:hypothetical protein
MSSSQPEHIVENVVDNAAGFIAGAKQHETIALRAAQFAHEQAIRARFFITKQNTVDDVVKNAAFAVKASIHHAYLAKAHAFAARQKAAEDDDNDADIVAADLAAAAADKHVVTAQKHDEDVRKLATFASQYAELDRQRALSAANMGN